MLTDRGVGPQLTAGHLEPGWLDGCDWLHLPAYSLAAEPVAGAALAAAAAIPWLSVDLSSGGRAEGLRPGPVPRPARAAGARGGVRQRGRGRPDRRPAGH
jgi:hypothetical protein